MTLSTKRDGYTLRHLGNGQGPDAVWREMLVENCRTAVADQVQFRIDFSDWLQHLPTRDRKMVLQLARGERVSHVARAFHL